MYSAQDQLNAKLQAQTAYETQTKCNLDQPAGCVQGVAPRGYTLSEDARRNEQFHYEQAQKAGDAARFLALHPEFDEFIRLVRAGALQF